MNGTSTPLVGAICDDLTGATDIALMFAHGGMGVVQHIGLPPREQAPQAADALVVSLKSRSICAADAVGQSLAACQFLKERGVRQVYFKYCSTFDSTPAGNIGPVAEALRCELGAPMVAHLPALPVNGRTVYQGHLFVYDQLLNETGMANHPLNPMTDANLVRVLQAQTPTPVDLISWPVVALGAHAVADALAKASAEDPALPSRPARHVIGDTISDADLGVWAKALLDAVLVAGGSGLARPLARGHMAAASRPVSTATPSWPSGPALILSGSCSQATLAQIAEYRAAGGACLQLDVAGLLAGASVVDDVLNWIAAQPACAPLIHASAPPDEIAATVAGRDPAQVARTVESALGDIARLAVASGRFRRLVVAGGETSGAVVQAIGATALRMGPEIAPGVPWTEAQDPAGTLICALALKSGNFGGDGFFARAIAEAAPR